MPRINVVDRNNASPEQRALLDAIATQLGDVPDYLGVVANSPAALRALLGLQGLATDGSLSPQTRIRIALALAQQAGSGYFVAAHVAAGRRTGLTGNEMAANREGCSEDARALVAVRLALSLARRIGDIATAELDEARAAGYTDADIVEIIAHVGLNLLTGILGNASQIEHEGRSAPD